MLPVKKHPNSEEIATADFARKLAPGEQLAAVVTQPVVRRKTPETATDPAFQTAVVNTEDLAVPNGERSVKAGQGVQFRVSGGDDGATYWIEIEATTTSDGRSVAVELPLIVDRKA